MPLYTSGRPHYIRQYNKAICTHLWKGSSSKFPPVVVTSRNKCHQWHVAVQERHLMFKKFSHISMECRCFSLHNDSNLSPYVVMGSFLNIDKKWKQILIIEWESLQILGFLPLPPLLGSIYTKRQHQCCDNSAMRLVIQLSLKNNGVIPEWGCNSFLSDTIVFNNSSITSVITESSQYWPWR